MGGEGCGELIWRLRHLHPDLEIIDFIFIPLFLRENPGLKMEVAAEVCALHEGVGSGSANSSREEPRENIISISISISAGEDKNHRAARVAPSTQLKRSRLFGEEGS